MNYGQDSGFAALIILLVVSVPFVFGIIPIVTTIIFSKRITDEKIKGKFTKSYFIQNIVLKTVGFISLGIPIGLSVKDRICSTNNAFDYFYEYETKTFIMLCLGVSMIGSILEPHSWEIKNPMLSYCVFGMIQIVYVSSIGIATIAFFV